jgi:hypothetical protein
MLTTGFAPLHAASKKKFQGRRNFSANFATTFGFVGTAKELTAFGALLILKRHV